MEVSSKLYLLLQDLPNHFGPEVSIAMLSLVGSSIQGCYAMVSPPVALILNYLGYRRTALAGIFICIMSFGACIILHDTFWAFATFYGVTNGLGMGCIYMAANTVAPLFFKKKKGWSWVKKKS